MMLRMLDLFSGIGGFSLGLERTGGFKTVGFCETDEYASRVLKKHWPEVPNYGDIRELDGRELSVDVISGGFPCQPFSQAGKRLGTNDHRHLWPEMRRVIQEAGPTWIIGENVAGLKSMVEYSDPSVVESRTGGRTAGGSDYQSQGLRTEHMLLHSICEDLSNLGYSVQPFIIPAVGVDARHRRDRVWIIAHDDRRRGERCAQEQIRSGRYAAESSVNSVADSKKQGLEGHARNGSDRDQPGRDDPQQNRPTGDRRICEFCGYEFDAACGKYGCPNCLGGEVVADTNSNERHGRGGTVQVGRERSQGEAQNDGDAGGTERSAESGMGSLADGLSAGMDGCVMWPTEPTDIPRTAPLVPERVAQLRALGNAVVPQVVEQLGRAILAS